MARLSRQNADLAAEIIGRYPVPRSALIPLLHLAQEQDGWLAPDAMEHIAELVGTTPDAFDKPLIKRHRPNTNRRNRRDEYRGCLQISVRQSANLYRRITGWVAGTVIGAERADLAASDPGVEHWRLVRLKPPSAVG